MSGFNRRKFIKGAAAGGVGATAVASPAIAQSMPEIKWRQTTSWPKSLDTLHGGAELIGKRVAELTVEGLVRPVDLVTWRSLRPAFREAVQRDAIPLLAR